MNKSEQNSNANANPKDLFSVYQQGFNSIFGTVRQYVPQYHQSITNVQQEYLQVCENFVATAVNMQKEFAKQAGVNTSVPEAVTKIAKESTNDIAKMAGIQNQMILATIDATQQNIKTFKDNTKSFADLNKNIIQSWISAFTPKN